ncbi:MAG: hypothetical protein ABI165_01960, partial [Bryobacteraceae bacterium]
MSFAHDRRWLAVVFLALAILFLIANRGAYRGYFSGDDLDTLAWTHDSDAGDFVRGLLLPKFYAHNFRPAGHLFYFLMVRAAGLRFPPYVAVIQALHLLNIVLLWLLARKLGLSIPAAFAAALFFGFHMAVFDVYWKPMYVFDLLCGFFCLLSLLAFANQRIVLSFVCFWLAYKSKEVAILLPVVLAAWEWWFGARRWKRLIPFVPVSLFFGVSALLVNRSHDNDYTLRFSPEAIWTCVKFYFSKLFLIPYAGLAILPLPFLVRDRVVRFGVTAFLAFLAPMLFLPGRLFGAYLCVPLIGAALALGAVAARIPSMRSLRMGHFLSRARKPAVLVPDGASRTFFAWAVVVPLFALWIPYNYAWLRHDRRARLAAADENRAYVAALAAHARRYPRVATFIYNGQPDDIYPWGVAGALRLVHPDATIVAVPEGEPGTVPEEASPWLGVLNWDAVRRRLTIVTRTP